MVPFSAKTTYKDVRILFSNIRKSKILYRKIIGSLGGDKHSGEQYKVSSLVPRIYSFDNAGLHLLTFRILGSYPSKDYELDLSLMSR